ncbi:MAG: isopeptide-forming domain-containing fimbrial protein [Oscillospiraceae bacterium]|nr:isopeptide-forming domain-containing fimbrial protein [Oscillospiraceae bacterium]
MGQTVHPIREELVWNRRKENIKKMKNIKKILALFLMLTVVVGLSTVVRAVEVTVEGAKTNETYNAYKLFDATIDGEKVSYTILKEVGEEGNKATNPVWTAVVGSASADNKGAYTANGLKFTPSAGDPNVFVVEQTDDFSAADLAAALNTILQGAEEGEKPLGEPITGSEGKITIPDDQLGYYFVDTTLGSLCSLVTPGTGQELYEKNSVPTLTKEVKEDSTGDFGESAHGDMGQTMQFKLTVNTGTNEQGAAVYGDDDPEPSGVDDNYVITDILPIGMTYTGDTFATTTGAQKVEGTDSTATVSISGWTLGTDLWVTYEGDVLTITLKADKVKTLGQDVDIEILYGARIDSDVVVGGDGNTNTAVLRYKNQVTTEVEATVYTYKFEVLKVDAENNETTLDGVKFTLKDSNGKYYVASTDNASIWQTEENAIATSDGGKITFTGLDAGTYTLTEVETKDGYNLLDGDVTVTISDTGEVSMDGAKSVENGVITIENRAGVVLPSTGGIGTTVFYVVGALLLFVPAIILVSKKKTGTMDK